MSITYNNIMKKNPTYLNHYIVNSLKQKVEFYEHPSKGDEAPVIAVCHDLKIAASTEFFDTDDFYEGSDYNPVFHNNRLVCEFEV